MRIVHNGAIYQKKPQIIGFFGFHLPMSSRHFGMFYHYITTVCCAACGRFFPVDPLAVSRGVSLLDRAAGIVGPDRLAGSCRRIVAARKQNGGVLSCVVAVRLDRCAVSLASGCRCPVCRLCLAAVWTAPRPLSPCRGRTCRRPRSRRRAASVRACRLACRLSPRVACRRR